MLAASKREPTYRKDGRTCNRWAAIASRLPFDPGLLPASLRPLAEDVADRMQVPLDLRAVVATATSAGNVEQIVNETIPAMRRLQEEGKCRYIGITGYPLKVLRRIAQMARSTASCATAATILWRVCARGHYFQQGEPIFDETSAQEVYDPFVDPPPATGDAEPQVRSEGAGGEGSELVSG